MADINLNIGSDDLKRLDKLLKDIQKAAKDLRAIMKSTGTTLGSDAQKAKALATATKKLKTEKKQLTAIEKEELRLERALATNKARLALATSKEARELIKVRKALTDVNRQMRTGGKITNAWGKALGSFQFKFNALGNIAANVTSQISRQLSRALRGAINIVVDFDKAMADVKSITGASGKEFDKLRDSAKALGGTTRFTATEVAKLQKEYAKLGLTTKEILGAQSATLDLAAATNTDLARAAEVVGITIRQFNLDASEAGRVTDVMARSFTTSALDMDKFAESMKMVGPIAKAAGYSLEETTSRIMQLADAGISGSMGGTALRQIFLEMAKGGKDLGNRIRQLSMEEIGLAQASDEVQKRAAAALLVLANGVGTVDDLTESLIKANGATREMAEIQLNTLEGQATLVKSAWEGMVLEISESESDFSGIKNILGLVSDILNSIAAGADGIRFAQAFAVTREIRQFIEEMDAVEMTTEELKTGWKGLGKTFKEIGQNIWNQMFPKEQATVVKQDLADISKLVENLKDELVIDEGTEQEDWVFGTGFWEDINKRAEKNLEYQNQLRDQKRKEDFERADAMRKLDETAAEKAEREKERKKQEIVDAGFDAAASTLNAFANIIEANKQKELSAVGDNAAKRLEIEKEYAKKQQKIAIGQARINTAEGVTKTASQLGFPLAIPFIIALGASMIGQIALIKSQKFAKGGWVDGEPHSRGGRVIEAEGGEFVVRKQAASKYKNLIEAINQDDQMRIQEAMSRDRKITVNGVDPYNRKLYELMRSKATYGEDNDYYYKEVGNTIIKTRKN